MAYNNENSSIGSLVFDCEAVAINGAGEYLEPVAAPSNYKDPDKIAAYCEQAQREALNRAALDIDLAKIVALGWMADTDLEPTVWLARDEPDERDALLWFWNKVAIAGQARPTLIGFNCLGYDLPLMLRRSLYLGVQAPRFAMGKYRHDGIEDLMLSLSFDGALKMRGLAFYCKRFGVEVADETSGKDIAALYAADDWATIEAHCASDVLKTAKLAQRVGVLHLRETAVL